MLPGIFTQMVTFCDKGDKEKSNNYNNSRNPPVGKTSCWAVCAVSTVSELHFASFDRFVCANSQICLTTFSVQAPGTCFSHREDPLFVVLFGSFFQYICQHAQEPLFRHLPILGCVCSEHSK